LRVAGYELQVEDPVFKRGYGSERSVDPAAGGIAGYLACKKPAVRSFFGANDAYTANTGAGTFSLKGDSI